MGLCLTWSAFSYITIVREMYSAGTVNFSWYFHPWHFWLHYQDNILVPCIAVIQKISLQLFKKSFTFNSRFVLRCLYSQMKYHRYLLLLHSKRESYLYSQYSQPRSKSNYKCLLSLLPTELYQIIIDCLILPPIQALTIKQMISRGEIVSKHNEEEFILGISIGDNESGKEKIDEPLLVVIKCGGNISGILQGICKLQLISSVKQRSKLDEIEVNICFGNVKYDREWLEFNVEKKEFISSKQAKTVDTIHHCNLETIYNRVLSV